MISTALRSLLFLGCSALAAALPAEEQAASVTYSAQDTLKPAVEDSADARACLEGLVWKPAAFTVTLERKGDQTFVRFPTAVSSGDAVNDLVALEWYAPKTDEGNIIKASAVVVVHESGSRMEVGRIFAKAISTKGFHAFLIHLPNYGLRKTKEINKSDGHRFLPAMRQAIADVRRARDAVAALPDVDARHIAVQGTSLGGFVAATTAGVDRGFNQAFIMVAGGDLLGVINGGRREAAEVRRLLTEAGYDGDKLKALAAAIEPTRLAHRVDPQSLWLYTAKDDQVVPRESALALKRAAHLADEHHIVLWGDHYKAILFFPVIVDHMADRLREFAAGLDGQSK